MGGGYSLREAASCAPRRNNHDPQHHQHIPQILSSSPPPPSDNAGGERALPRQRRLRPGPARPGRRRRGPGPHTSAPARRQTPRRSSSPAGREAPSPAHRGLAGAHAGPRARRSAATSRGEPPPPRPRARGGRRGGARAPGDGPAPPPPGGGRNHLPAARGLVRGRRRGRKTIFPARGALGPRRTPSPAGGARNGRAVPPAGPAPGGGNGSGPPARGPRGGSGGTSDFSERGAHENFGAVSKEKRAAQIEPEKTRGWEPRGLWALAGPWSPPRGPTLRSRPEAPPWAPGRTEGLPRGGTSPEGNFPRAGRGEDFNLSRWCPALATSRFLDFTVRSDLSSHPDLSERGARENLREASKEEPAPDLTSKTANREVEGPWDASRIRRDHNFRDPSVRARPPSLRGTSCIYSNSQTTKIFHD